MSKGTYKTYAWCMNMSVFSRQGLGADSTRPIIPTTSQKDAAHLMCTPTQLKSVTPQTIRDPHKDARAIVRLIQCPQCSLPINKPLTLPCGNSLCRKCLPELHHRDNISYPNTKSRHEAFICPFSNCGRHHVLGDCCQDITLSRVMETIGNEVAKSRPMTVDTPTLLDERLHWKNMIDSSKDERTPSARILNGGRLVATYTLAEMGELRYDSEVAYQTMSGTADTYENLDIRMLSQLKEATKNELDCQVCYNLIHDPLTSPCGHTFCRHCVARILDHSPLCPACRQVLYIPPGAKGVASNQWLTNLLSALCPELVAERADQIAKESAVQGNTNIPLFVCTNGFPSMPTFLHIFEPRYRLMIRRAVESGDRKFGILMYNHRMESQGALGPTQFMQYGTMLHINTVQMTIDGRSMLDTRGIYRFRVKSWDMLDGYIVGDVEQLSDIPLAEEEALETRETTQSPASQNDLSGQIDRMPTVDLLHICLDFVRRMRATSAPWLRGAHFESHGEMPDDPALFPYWFASILPISEDEKYKLLPTTSVRERLKISAKWVRRIESQRW